MKIGLILLKTKKKFQMPLKLEALASPIAVRDLEGLSLMSEHIIIVLERLQHTASGSLLEWEGYLGVRRGPNSRVEPVRGLYGRHEALPRH